MAGRVVALPAAAAAWCLRRGPTLAGSGVRAANWLPVSGARFARACRADSGGDWSPVSAPRGTGEVTSGLCAVRRMIRSSTLVLCGCGEYTPADDPGAVKW